MVDDAHIYTDMAASGPRKDRTGLNTLLQAASGRQFEVVLIDDLSRLARNTLLMLTVLEELRFNGVRVLSVADGLDSTTKKRTSVSRCEGVFNELQLTDLRKKTLRGQIGQKQRGSRSESRRSDIGRFRLGPFGWTRRAGKGRRAIEW